MNEIIVMDDASTDYTSDVVSDFQSHARIDIKYFRNEKNVGSSISRNLAVKKAKNDRVIFLDDDCIFSPYFVFGANFTMEHLPEDVAAVHLPIYHRKMNPVPVEGGLIGILDLENGIMDGNYGGFPISFAEDIKSNYMDEELGIVKPLEIKNLGGVFIAKKAPFQEIGGFPENISWRNGYREETHVAIDLAKAGYRMFFTPDPKFHSVHLKYGAQGKKEEIKGASPKLRRLINQSNIHIENTGNRVDMEEWFFDRIISTYVTIGKEDKKAARRYLEVTEKEFVIDNNLGMTGVGNKISDPELRREIFEKAVTEGSRLLGVSA
jgi:glycosyltransferase involved in cell wall biosynthesis